eukprot:TRINITY_DN13448_c0_g1_i1.p1 TRINITY_DN13448_c0_g1~~TRINITY_DN13448_c0_g1_i1.p1  ORF type:complete len:630 (+),score=147.67 TRINITY_DN13448_c0_g1_i1:163-1890(+)
MKKQRAAATAAPEVVAALQEDGLRMASGRRLEGALARAAKVFGGGPLLHAVQQAGLFKDSKHFVDMPMKEDPEMVLAAFHELQDPSDKKALEAFVKSYFDDAGSELEPWTPEDFQEAPALLKQIKDEAMQTWALGLNRLWATLGRRPHCAVESCQQRYSSLPQRFPTIVPGGRFRETYYWDTYWVIRGLLVCGMLETAKGVAENLLDSVRKFGFVPNGTRVYYLDRSQPPLLTDMVMAIHSVSGDDKWLADVLPVLESEYAFWMSPDSGHLACLSGKRGPLQLNVYHSARAGPRPEAYVEDLEAARQAPERDAAEVYRGLCSGAESGWDFSSRWLDSRLGGGDTAAKICSISTQNVVPVDLNCFLLRVEEGLAKAYKVLARPGGEKYLEAASKRKEAMEEIFWIEEAQSYRDFCLDAGRSSSVAALSDFATPFWAGLHSSRPGDALQGLQRSGLLQAGGAASTSVNTQGATQWDAPNAWPPLQHMLIEGLEQLPGSQGPTLARDLAQRWLSSCYQAWQRSGFMYEKYNADVPGEGGDGGEYDPQVGFGWSNGVVLVFLARNWLATSSDISRCTVL